MKVQPDGAISTGTAGSGRQSFTSSSPDTPTNVTSADNSPVMMNKSGLMERGSRADDLIAMAGDDSARLSIEPPRRGKMKG